MSRAQVPPQALAQLAAVTDGTVRIGPLLGIPAVLRDLGQDPDPVFVAAKVDPHLFDDPENTIEFSSLGRLASECVEHTGRPDFGLLVGRRTGLPALGLVGVLAGCSPDLGTALHNLILHLHLHDSGALPRLTVGKGRAVFSYTIYQPAGEDTAQIYDAAVAIMNNILRTLYGPGWQPSEVLLARAEPLDAEPYRKFFRAPIRFGAEQSAVVFPSAWLAHPVPGADPGLLKETQDRIAAIESMGGVDIVVQVRRVLCNLIMSGEASMDAVAGIFAIHRRTLNRRLRERGVTLRQLVEDVRRQLARQLLRDTDLPVLAIAETLGYADNSAFTRAFRRWSGTAPSAWRSARRRA